MKTNMVKKCKAPVKSKVTKTTLNNLRDEMRESARGLGSLYFEARVVADIQFGDHNDSKLLTIAVVHDFRMENGELVLKSTKLDRVKEQLANLAEDLKKHNRKIWRYRIGEVMVDSNNFDSLKIL